MTDDLVGIQMRALAALMEVADDPAADGLARVLAADTVLHEAKEQAKRERKAAKKKAK